MLRGRERERERERERDERSIFLTFLVFFKRYERIYRPFKLTQFDKIFAYDFNVPVALHANLVTFASYHNFVLCILCLHDLWLGW